VRGEARGAGWAERGGAGRVWAKKMKRRNKKQHHEFIQHRESKTKNDIIAYLFATLHEP